MALNYQHLINLRWPERTFTYTEDDTILYAVGVGMGREPGDLRYVYERGLAALPTLATVIAWDDTWQEDTGMTIEKIVHGEMRVTLHRPLEPRGTVISSHRIVDVFDKGPTRGAVLLAETRLRDPRDRPVATLLSTVMARGDGGFGGPAGKGPAPRLVPERAPDLTARSGIRPEQALIYRLSGDRNPLHVDPAVASAAGFDRPILHGLCSYGVATAGIVRELCPDDAGRITHVEARFTAPVVPGDTLVTDIWRAPGGAHFRSRVASDDGVVLDNGYVEISNLKG
ncbi:MAG: Acyl dehydratase [Rhodobacteraceae bacterium HLUCCA12]|nr:MAG: Acyl dehydratase [Rhodobacteraceae bacterium HLUCCA12]